MITTGEWQGLIYLLMSCCINKVAQEGGILQRYQAFRSKYLGPS
jgi:hypothetical protein